VSYCRVGDDSDVYLIRALAGKVECIACRLEGPRGFVAKSERAMLAHLRKHLQAGQKVPQRAFDRLNLEAAERDQNSHG